jgi:hypothetical protein
MKTQVSIAGLVILFSLQGMGQSLKRKIEEIWQNKDSVLQVNELPAEFKNEPAVILANYYEISPVNGSDNVVQVLHRKRIYLNDKSALEYFSQFYFNQSTGFSRFGFISFAYSLAGVRVKKKNGKEIEIDLNKIAVNADQFSGVKKVAIPGLEVGDILDYFYAYRKNSNFLENHKMFFAEDYPTLKTRIKISYNNRHALVYVPIRCEIKESRFNQGESESGKIFDTGFLKPVTNEKWADLEREAKGIALRLFVNENRKLSEFVPETMIEKSKLKDGVTKTATVEFHELESFVSYRHSKPKEIYPRMFDTYYLLRNQFLRTIFLNPQKTGVFAQYGTAGMVGLSEEYKIYSALYSNLKAGNIPFTSCYSYKKQNGRLTENPFPEESPDVIVQLNPDTGSFLCFPDTFSLPCNLDPVYDGQDFIREKSVNSTSKADYKYEQQLPFRLRFGTGNFVKTTLYIEPDTSTLSVKISRETSADGFAKSTVQRALFTEYDYTMEYKKEFPELMTEEYPADFFSYKVKLENKTKDIQLRERAKRMKEFLSEKTQEKVLNYNFGKISSMGIWHKSPQAIYSETYSLKGIINRGGNVYVFNMGKLLDREPVLKKDSLRKMKVFPPADLNQEYEIRLKVPSGMSAAGLENLESKTENGAGTLISAYELKGNELIVKVSIQLKKSSYPAAEFNELAAFYQAVQEFCYRKLLLRKT